MPFQQQGHSVTAAKHLPQAATLKTEACGSTCLRNWSHAKMHRRLQVTGFNRGWISVIGSCSVQLVWVYEGWSLTVVSWHDLWQELQGFGVNSILWKVSEMAQKKKNHHIFLPPSLLSKDNGNFNWLKHYRKDSHTVIHMYTQNIPWCTATIPGSGCAKNKGESHWLSSLNF